MRNSHNYSIKDNDVVGFAEVSSLIVSGNRGTEVGFSDRTAENRDFDWH